MTTLTLASILNPTSMWNMMWMISHDKVSCAGTSKEPFTFRLSENSLSHNWRFSNVTFLVHKQPPQENADSCWATFALKVQEEEVPVPVFKEVELGARFSEEKLELFVYKNNMPRDSQPLTLGILLTVTDGNGNCFTSPDPQLILGPSSGG
jgi:hypothetical protein